MATHLRSVAIAVPRNDRPPLAPNDLVDVYSIDPFSGSVARIVDAGRVIDVDDSRIVIAIPTDSVVAVAGAAASRQFTVVGR